MSAANDLTIACLRVLETYKVMAWRQNNHATPIRKQGKIIGLRAMPKGSRKGVPDIIAIVPPYGLFWAIEIKIGRDKLSDDQIQFKHDVQKAGGFYDVISSLDDLLDRLKSGFELRDMSKSNP